MLGSLQRLSSVAVRRHDGRGNHGRDADGRGRHDQNHAPGPGGTTRIGTCAFGTPKMAL